MEIREGGRNKGGKGRKRKGKEECEGDRGLGRLKGWMRKGGDGYGDFGGRKARDAPGCGNKQIWANVTMQC
jgi:hypothetical protein